MIPSSSIARVSRLLIAWWRAIRYASSVPLPSAEDNTIAGRTASYRTRPSTVSSSGWESPFLAQMKPV